MEQEQKKLKIPTNISDRDEFISGIGKNELMVICIMFFVSILVLVLIYSLTQSFPLGFMSAFFISTLTVMLVMRDKIGENMIDKIKILIQYVKMQKKYEYRKNDVFGEGKYE